MDKKKKKTSEKEGRNILNVLIPDQLKKVNENSGWCGTVSLKPNVAEKKKGSKI